MARLRSPFRLNVSPVYLLFCSSLCSAYCDEDLTAVYGLASVDGTSNDALRDSQLNQVCAACAAHTEADAVVGFVYHRGPCWTHSCTCRCEGIAHVKHTKSPLPPQVQVDIETVLHLQSLSLLQLHSVLLCDACASQRICSTT